MQKFTVFSIILSLCVIFILGDMVFHGYLNTSVLSVPVESGTGTEIAPAVENIVIHEDGVPVAKLTAAHLSAAGFTNPVLKNAVLTEDIFFLNSEEQCK
mgnify:CR=1 FL=1